MTLAVGRPYPPELFVRGTYAGVTFKTDAEGLSVEVRTERLAITSVGFSDTPDYFSLYGNPDVVQRFADGKTKSLPEVAERVRGWVARWAAGDPYSALTVRRQEDFKFVGAVVLGHGDHPGESELAGLGVLELWGQGLGKEAATAVARDYAPATKELGALRGGVPLETITATARPDNPASCKILEGMGFSCVGEAEKFGALRRFYALKV